MKIFLLSVIVAVGIALSAKVILAGHEQESAEHAFASSSARP